MKICLIILLLVSAYSIILCQNPDEESWINDGYQNQVHLLESELLQTMLKHIIQTPGLQNYNGIMGRKSLPAKSRMTRKRQKFQTFVGLMGKRNMVEPGSFQEEIKHIDSVSNIQPLMQMAA